MYYSQIYIQRQFQLYGTFKDLCCFRQTSKYITMENPKEKDEQAKISTDDTTQQQSGDTQDTNWEHNQQVDEEGNEIDPEDIK